MSPVPAVGHLPEVGDGGRGEEARAKAVGAGLERQLREGTGSFPKSPGSGPPRQARCRWGGPKPFPPACEVFAHIRVFYLGMVDEVQEQLAWGSAKVYLERPPLGPPTSH